jgi:hypothetical protein
VVDADEWSGVDDPDTLRAQVADWLGRYANAGSRRTYALALGLPRDLRERARGVS